VLASLTAAPVPVPAAVARALAGVTRDPTFGRHLTGLVVDGQTGRPLLSLAASSPVPPASTAKLLTAAAALEVLGPDATLTTRVVRAGTTLYLVGGGDVTLRATAARRATFPAAATVATLARRTVAALGGTRATRLCLDTSAWTGPSIAPGWKPTYFSDGDIARLSPLEVDEGNVPGASRPHANTPRVPDPAAQAGAAYTAALRARGVAVHGRCLATAPRSAVPVASVASPPVSELVQRMLTVSDNDLAESLGRAVAARSGSPATFAGEAAAVTASVRHLGVDVTALTLVDASGLSRLDRVTPAMLVQLVRLALGDAHPELRPLVQGLPVAGFSGTLGGRYRSRRSVAAAGLAHAKTGTLLGVNALAGYVVDADGRLLVFAFVTDRGAGVDATEAALDRVVARLADCGCR